MRSSAFTLIELTLVTVIILALLALSIPLFKRTFLDLSAKDAAFNISKLVTYAQEKAIIDRKNYKAVFDFNRRQYQLQESDQTAGGPGYKRMQGRFGKVYGLPQGIFFYDPKTGITQKTGEEYVEEVVFYPDGHCDELLINMIDNRGTGYSITLKGFGSLARIKEVKSEI